jgi:hypothetical protein
MCPRFGNQRRPIHWLTLHGSQVLPSTKRNSDTESLCPRSSPGQLLAEETLPMSSNLRYPIQLNSRRQISYTASDIRTPGPKRCVCWNPSCRHGWDEDVIYIVGYSRAELSRQDYLNQARRSKKRVQEEPYRTTTRHSDWARCPHWAWRRN